jgi:DNA (cytosine-5)-methyltransferase 1
MERTAISLFSGLGGDTLGLCQSKVNVIAYSEINRTFCKSHEANFPNSTLLVHENQSDITKLPDSVFLAYQNKVDILFAGFPCQGFSQAGKKRDDDPRNTMFMEFVRATRLIQPRIILGENVKGLLKKKTPQGEWYIQIIVSEFQKLGYDVHYQVMKCEHFGVPQKRERCIIVGVQPNPYGWTPTFPTPQKKSSHLKNIIRFDMTGAVAAPAALFSTIPSECILTNMEDHSIGGVGHPYLHSKLDANVDKRTYQKKTHDVLFSFGKRDSPIHCEIIDIRKPSKTIICTYDHQPRLFVPLRNSVGFFLRIILPDELKQIQGFPEDYILMGNKKDTYVQIGNAVPPPLIRAVVSSILHYT